jgi:trans-aconitate methyltransferase
MPPFDQAEYWRSRHRRLRGDPRSVGNLGSSLEESERSQAVVQRTVKEAARMLKPARSVLDLGCGYGRVSRSFTDEGYEYLGVDVSEDAVEAARRANPSAKFVVSDLSAWSPDRRFDVVVALYVLVHFVDDDIWRRLLEKIFGWLRDGGVILLADVFPDSRASPVAHVVNRPIAEYRPILQGHGFDFDDGFRESLMSTCGAAARNFRLARKATAG